jgi:ABC-2 type transport system permease protein
VPSGSEPVPRRGAGPRTLHREVVQLLRPKWQSMRNRMRFREEGDLGRSLILLVLVVGFWAGIYLVFSNFLYQFRIIEEFGDILPGKLLSMIFLLFLGTLMWSALLTSFGVFFLSGDLQLLRSAPVSESALYLARLAETTLNASWMVLLFGLPVFIAYGVVFRGDVVFYLIVAVANLSFVLIPAVLGVALTMVLVNLFPAQRAKDVLMVVSLIFFGGLIAVFRVLRPERLLDPDSFTSMVDFFRAMQAPLSPLLPSQWAAEAISTYLVGTLVYDPFWLALLVLSAGAAVVLGMWLSERSYDYGFTKTQEVRRHRLTRSPLLDRLVALYSLFWSRQLKEMISKDVKTFLRDITQWSQLFLLAALVVIYVYNFRALPLANNLYLPTFYLTHLVAFFNMGLAGFTVSAVAARFVFPAVSLEGRAFWLVRSSPLGLKGYLWSKFWISFFPLLLLGETLIVLTNFFLGVHPVLAWTGAVFILLITLGVVGLGVGVGATYPRFNWENVSQIPAGFGGTIFMVLALSFVLVLLVIMWGPLYGIMIPLTQGRVVPPEVLTGAAVSGLLVVLVCLGVFLLPMEFGLRRLADREVW